LCFPALRGLYEQETGQSIKGSMGSEAQYDDHILTVIWREG
jgi:hypothetical protein